MEERKCRKRKPRAPGKGLDVPCLVCGERRFTEWAHFPTRKRKGEDGKETIPLCPTHHRLLEFGRLSRDEFKLIMASSPRKDFDSVEDFVRWAYGNCYPYSLEDLERKFWSYRSK